jgi:restriction endonuclease S subunit
MIKFWIQSDKIRNGIYLPKYYDPEITSRLDELETSHDLVCIADLIANKTLLITTGDEVGKGAYGTGDIPFVRTSDIVNWEIKTAPKQGVSQDIYNEYAKYQNVEEGDILLVRDGAYLIGANCFVTKYDKQLLFQSHLLKLRVNDKENIDPHLLFLALNCRIVQRQMRSFQFTADIIDTIGRRFFDVILPIPKNREHRHLLVERTDKALKIRMKGKAFIKHCPFMMEKVLETGSTEPLDIFSAASEDEIYNMLQQETVSSEFGGFTHFWIYSDKVCDSIFVPKYYEPSVCVELKTLKTFCDLYSFKELRENGVLEYHTGDEIGKMAYGSGDIPFIRTSDFSNWEIKHDPKQGVSKDIYDEYAAKEDVRENDIFLVRDGTYLIGSSCIVTKEDVQCLFCGGLYKIRVLQPDKIDPFLLLGLLNSWIVKRQIRTKQFTRDVIDTIGNRIDEVILPIPKNKETCNAISQTVREVIHSRIWARQEISTLSLEFETNAISSR